MNDEQLREHIVGEERVFEGRLVRVGRVDVTLPDGRPATREVVRHVGASAVVPVDGQGRVYLVKQYRAALDRIMWEIPAGKLDGKSEDRLRAAKRELREETGLTAEKWTHLGDIVTTPGFCDEVISLYLAEGLAGGEQSPDEDEFLSVQTLSLDEAVDMCLTGRIGDAKTVCGLLMAQKALQGRR